jgi:outer membrane protein
MKQIKTLLIAALFIEQVRQLAHKQKQLNDGEIMAKMPAMLDAQKQLEKLSGTYDSDKWLKNIKQN